MFGSDYKNLYEDEHYPRIVNAAKNGDVERVKFLINVGDKVNVNDEYGETPLHCAVYIGDIAMVKLLLEAGSNINAKNNEGETPLHEAAYKGHVEIAKFLIEAGAR